MKRATAGVLCLVLCICGSAGFLSADQSYKKKIYIRGYTPRNTAVKSALFPGWGQYANHEIGKAYTVSALFIASCGASAVLYQKALSVYDDYKDTGIKDDGLYQDYKSYHSASIITAGAAVTVWLYSVAQAYMFTRDELNSRNHGQAWQIYFQKNEAMLAFQHKF